MTILELIANSISRTAYDATLNQPLHVLYAKITPRCPSCDQRLSATAFGPGRSELRTLWRCQTEWCREHRQSTVFALTTYVVEPES